MYFLSGTQYWVSLETDPNGFQQVALHDNTGLLRYLTTELYEVSEIFGWNQARQRVFYQVAKPDATQRHIYSVDLNGESSEHTAAPWLWNYCSMSPQGNYYILYNDGPAVPEQYLINAFNNSVVRVLETNADLKSLLLNYDVPQRIFFQIPLNTTAKETLEAFFLLPAGFDPYKVYPVFNEVYGGPAYQLVTQQYISDMFPLYIASHGYIYGTVDPRGSSGKGDAFTKQIYKYLGKYAKEDLATAASYMKKTFDYVQPAHFGMWGWSFGGHVATSVSTIVPSENPYDVIVAVAPVTDWSLYDSIYTERYMQTPATNAEGYAATSVLAHVDNMKTNFTKSLLVAHGTADDNVHFMNTCYFNKLLVEANVMFDTMFYVDMDHSINGPNGRPHLYRTISNFLQRELGPPLP
eukprot:TRINITY_DN189_c0_g1_i3.p1 TRINITY_DN189_c0_g1~~TRINITY_DN189_c0_g1_i3.p1  ORF type:complete len:473 (+),score=135.27 TRINITY_DN189_c0_g1_i3:197-1420(+)